MDWETVTATWVQQGLVTAEQAPALRAWLDEHAPSSSGPLTDAALTVLAVAAVWLLTGASVLLSSQTGGNSWDAGLVAFIEAVVWAGIGFGVGRGMHAAVGQGLLAGAVVVAPLALFGLLDRSPDRLDWEELVLCLLPAMLGTGCAVWRAQSGLAAASAMAAAIVLVPWVFDQPAPVPELLVGAATMAIALPNLLAYRARLEATSSSAAATLQAQAAFIAMIGGFAAFAHTSYGTGPNAWLWEAGLLLTGFGAALLGLGALGRSRMTLVGGLGVLVAAEITFLTAFGDVMAAIVILSVEGLALLAAAVAVVVARAGRAVRQREREAQADAG